MPQQQPAQQPAQQPSQMSSLYQELMKRAKEQVGPVVQAAQPFTQVYSRIAELLNELAAK
jgi:hypothetical protein